jgi:hypothetical protein
MDRWTDGQIDSRVNRQTDGHKVEIKSGSADKFTDGQINEWTEGQTDRKLER